jgi:A/G-specific adenine glycosylase
LHPADEKRTRQLPARLLAWYDRAKRDLPWRRTRSAYRIWLAEVMLQQTRVETVVPYYHRFLRRFPSLRKLAAASVDDVLERWAGLGYYSRARNFHAAARAVVERHGGRVPRDLDAMLALPGVGRYTAGAVVSIAFGVPAPIVDGNVARVLCRIFGLEGAPKAAPLKARLWGLAAELVPDDRPGDFNQAMMELGATVCTPKAPACDDCPLAAGGNGPDGGRPGRRAPLCDAFRTGRQAELPTPQETKTVPHVDVAVGLVWRRGKLLITKRSLDVMLGGLWEFPGGKVQPAESPADALRRELLEETGLSVRVEEPLCTVDHAYSHFRVTLHAFRCASARGRVRLDGPTAFRWVTRGQLADFPFPAGTVRIIRKLQW